MKIGIISQWYPPEPAHIPATLAAGLAARGHRVRVLTGFPNYPEGRTFPGYRQRWVEQATMDGVAVRRVPLYPSHDSSPVRRSANYLSFAATSTLAAERYLAGADVLYVYHPPATAFTAAVPARLLRRVPVVLHVQDVWPESVTASSMVPGGPAGRLLGRALHLTMRGIYMAAAAVVAIAPSMRDLLVARGAPPERVHTVLNWTDEKIFRPMPATDRARRAIGHRGRCTIMYAGNIGPCQEVAGAVRAAAVVRDQVDLVLVGSGLGERHVRGLADRLSADNVRFVPRQPATAMPELYAATDFQLIALRDLPTMRGTIPSKLQASLACGLPVVAYAPGDSARFVEQHAAGITCPPEDWRVLAETFTRAASVPAADRRELGQRARLAYQEHMSQQSGVDQIEKLLCSAAERRAA